MTQMAFEGTESVQLATEVFYLGMILLNSLPRKKPTILNILMTQL